MLFALVVTSKITYKSFNPITSLDSGYAWISIIPLFKIVDTYEFLDFLREIEIQSLHKEEKNELIDNAK